MSYILDALKKAEKERQLESVPDLQTIHSPTPGRTGPGAAKSRLVKTVFFLLALTCGAAVIYSFKDTIPISSGVVEHGLHFVSTTPVVNEPRVHPAPSPEPVVGNIQDSQRALPDTSSSDKQSSTLSATQVPLLHEMEADFRSRIPEITYAGHTYSENPQHRLIIINDRIMKEGQRIEGNLKLAEITWEGIILDFNGTQFRLNTSQK